jgi:hypothetical protein
MDDGEHHRQKHRSDPEDLCSKASSAAHISSQRESCSGERAAFAKGRARLARALKNAVGG